MLYALTGKLNVWQSSVRMPNVTLNVKHLRDRTADMQPERATMNQTMGCLYRACAAAFRANLDGRDGRRRCGCWLSALPGAALHFAPGYSHVAPMGLGGMAQ